MKNHPSKEQTSRRKSTSSLTTSSKSKGRRFSEPSIHKAKKTSQSSSPPQTPLPITDNNTNHYNQNYFYFNDDVFQTLPQNVGNGDNDEQNEHKLTNMQIFAPPTTEPHQSTTTTNSCNISTSNIVMNTSTSNYLPPVPSNDSIINSHSNQIINTMNFNELSNCIVTIENNNHHHQQHHQQILPTPINPTSNQNDCPFQYVEIESNSITTVSCDAAASAPTTATTTDRLVLPPPYLIYPNGVDNSCCYNNSSIGNNHSVNENNVPSPLYSDDDNNENEIGCSLIQQQEESEFIQIDFMNSDYFRKLLTSSNDNDHFDDLENYFKDIF